VKKGIARCDKIASIRRSLLHRCNTGNAIEKEKPTAMRGSLVFRGLDAQDKSPRNYPAEAV
jgi:hypothetical protein